MSCLEWVILILVLGLVTMVEICAITITVGRVIDSKMKTKMTMEYKIFRAEMKEVTNLLDVYFDKFLKLIGNDTTEEARIGYAKFTQPKKKMVVNIKDCAKDDPDLDELEDDLDDWLK